MRSVETVESGSVPGLLTRGSDAAPECFHQAHDAERWPLQLRTSHATTRVNHQHADNHVHTDSLTVFHLHYCIQ